MVYCTFIYGKELHDLYSTKLDEFSTKYNLQVLTDKPDYFLNANTTLYERNEFSYYEKLPFLLSLVKKYKERVLFFDADSIDLIDGKEFGFDNRSAYSYQIFKNTNYTESELRTNYGLGVLCDIYSELGYEMCDYLHERIISIPNTKKIDKIYTEILNLQSLFEKKYPKGIKWVNHDFKKYSKVGCGYGEGGALSVVLKNNNINVKSLVEKKLM